MPYALPVPGVQPVLQPALVLALQQEAQPEMMASVAAREAALPRGAPALVSVPVPFPDSLGLQIPAQSLLQPAVPRLPGLSALLPGRAVGSGAQSPARPPSSAAQRPDAGFLPAPPAAPAGPAASARSARPGVRPRGCLRGFKVSASTYLN
nr:uncharacterized protein LOC106027171 [Cavia porcellus]